MKHKLNIIPLLLVTVAFGLIAWALVYYEENYLWKVQELNLFLDTALFFKQQMVVSGGILTYLGTFFTDFFYHSWLGVLILCAWWAVLLVLSALTFKVPLKWLTVLLVPVALLLLSNVELGYWIYYLKLRGYFFVATIGLTAGIASVWGFRCLPKMVRPAYIVAGSAVLYPLLGFYGLLAVALMGLLSWRLKDMSLKLRLLNTFLALAAIIVVPMIYYQQCYYQTNSEDIYFTALPLFEMDDFFASYYIPFILLTVFYALMALSYGLWGSGQVRKPVIWGLVQCVLIGGLVYGVQKYWYKDYNFHKELAMNRAMEAGDWNGVIREAANLQDEPTRSIVMMKNLALFRLGRLGDEAYHYRQGAKASNTPIDIRMTQVVGRDIYFYFGQLNFCHRWCLEDGVEYGWRAVYLKYMIRCSLMDEEYEVAAKYINILKHTRYHQAWAEQQEQYLHHREKLKASKEYGPLFHLRDFKDQLSSDNGLVEYFLMHLLVNVETDDPEMQELVLFAALWTKDIPTFWPRFNKYAVLHQGKLMPRHYQEAAYLYGNLEHQVDISRMPFDAQVKEDYENFMKLAQSCAGMTEAQMRPVFYPRFGHTFYYDYFLIRNQKLY